MVVMFACVRSEIQTVIWDKAISIFEGPAWPVNSIYNKYLVRAFIRTYYTTPLSGYVLKIPEDNKRRSYHTQKIILGEPNLRLDMEIANTVIDWYLFW